jgi:hypothetical protein
MSVRLHAVVNSTHDRSRTHHQVLRSFVATGVASHLSASSSVSRPSHSDQQKTIAVTGVWTPEVHRRRDKDGNMEVCIHHFQGGLCRCLAHKRARRHARMQYQQQCIGQRPGSKQCGSILQDQISFQS